MNSFSIIKVFNLSYFTKLKVLKYIKNNDYLIIYSNGFFLKFSALAM